MKQSAETEVEERIAVKQVSAFVGLIHSRLRGHFSKASSYKEALNLLGVHVRFSNSEEVNS